MILYLSHLSRHFLLPQSWYRDICHEPGRNPDLKNPELPL